MSKEIKFIKTLTSRLPGEIIAKSRKGIAYKTFAYILNEELFDLEEWSVYLHLSLRTLQRYQKQKIGLDATATEKILAIIELCLIGEEVFGDQESFSNWLRTNNLALGNVKPKELLDTAKGISMVMDELIRIEHGILA